MMTTEERLDQLEKRRGLLTVGSIAMMVVIAIQFSACGKDPAGPSTASTDCDISYLTALAGRNLSKCNLAGANMYEANLVGANLEGANLKGANLQFADLDGANLKGANLEGAELQHSDFEGANLEGANLKGVDFTEGYLKDANLKGANLEDAYGVPVLSAKQREEACWSDCD